MKSNKKKGDMAEKELYDLIKKKNPELMVTRSPRTMKRVFIKGRIVYVSQANDFCDGLYDLMIKNNKGLTTWIQVKAGSSNNVYTALKKIRAKKQYFNPDTEFICVYLRVARKGWVIYDLEGDKAFYDLKLNPVGPFKVTCD